MTDPIADMLTRIRNGLAVHKTEVFVPFSKLKLALAAILVQEGYLKSAERVTVGGFDGIALKLHYDNDRSRIHFLRRVSKPGRRIYVNHADLPYVLNDLGIAVISTSQGVMTNKSARKAGLGGEVLCEIG